MNRYIAACGLVMLFVMSAPALAQRSNGYSDRYGVLADRNIFLKDRTHPSTRPATQPSRDDPELSLKLTGVVMEPDGFRAYVENIHTEIVQRLAVGDSVARGKVVGIEIDAIAYEARGAQPVWIAIGHDLAGRAVMAPGESYMPSLADASAPTTTPAGMENINPNDPNLTMEQKLKLRRMQEMKGK